METSTNNVEIEINTQYIFLSCLVYLLFSGAIFSSELKTNAEIKKEIISQSIQSYSDNCPCPYNRASNGYKCGKRSAWNRAGGYAPICYENEITDEMINRWKNSH